MTTEMMQLETLLSNQSAQRVMASCMVRCVKMFGYNVDSSDQLDQGERSVVPDLDVIRHLQVVSTVSDVPSNYEESVKTTWGHGSTVLDYEYPAGKTPRLEMFNASTARLTDITGKVRCKKNMPGVMFRRDSLICHLNMLKGSWLSTATEDRPALGMGRLAPSMCTDEAIKGACYFYACLSAIFDGERGHWGINNDVAHKEFKQIFSQSVITIVQDFLSLSDVKPYKR
jgi:hypothetical protein